MNHKKSRSVEADINPRSGKLKHIRVLPTSLLFFNKFIFTTTQTKWSWVAEGVCLQDSESDYFPWNHATVSSYFCCFNLADRGHTEKKEGRWHALTSNWLRFHEPKKKYANYLLDIAISFRNSSLMDFKKFKQYKTVFRGKTNDSENAVQSYD